MVLKDLSVELKNCLWIYLSRPEKMKDASKQNEAILCRPGLACFSLKMDDLFWDVVSVLFWQR